MAAIFALILVSTFLLATAAPQVPPNPSPSPDSSEPGCVDELVAISPCLGYVAAQPNNATDTVSSQCCEAFFNAFNSRDGNCFCYLVNQPLIFGFPLNEARVLSLPTVCASGNRSMTTEIGKSMESTCSAESPVLPPLQSSTGVQIPKPPALDPHNGSSPSASWPTSEPVLRSPTAAQQEPTSRSSTVKNICNRFLLEALLSLAIYFVDTFI